jgi:hypothetical protein
LEAPWSTWTQPTQWTAADGLTTALWCASSIATICDLAFTFASDELIRFVPDLGPILDTGIGFGLLGLAAATVMYQARESKEYTGWDVANSLVPQFQRPFRFFILSKDNEEVAPFALGALTISDAVVGGGSFLTQLFASVFDWEKPSSPLFRSAVPVGA